MASKKKKQDSSIAFQKWKAKNVEWTVFVHFLV